MSVKKEPDSSKCFKKKCNPNPTMEQKPVIPSKARTSRSFIQVAEDVHLILDDSDADIPSATPREKSVQLPRKTYSKRNPIVYQPIKARETSNRLKVDTFISHGASSSICKSSPLPSGNKNLLRKRKKDIEPIFSESSVPKKSVRKNTFKYGNASQSSTPKDSRPSTSKSFDRVPVKHEGSSDSEVEILSVKLAPTTEKSTNSTIKKFSNNNNNLSNKKSNKCFESMAKKELLINEAEIAPFVPTNPNIFPDPPNRANSMRWLSANGTIAVPGYSQGFSPSTLKPQVRSENENMPVEKGSIVLSPDLKLSTEKKSKGKRELKGLYENLNEISWAHETSFKNLLRSPDYIRHSERSTGRIAGTGKNLRKLKPQTQPQAERIKRETAASLLARKKSKMARLNYTQKGKQVVREKLLSRAQNKKERKQAQIIKKKVLPKLKSSSHDSTDDDDTIRYKLASDPPKLKQNTGMKTKTVATKTKLSNGLKLKPDPSKLNSDAQKVKSNIFKLKPDKPIAKVKKYVPVIKHDSSPPSTSGLQSGSSSSKGLSHSKSADIRNSIKKNSSFTNFPPEMQFFQSMLDADNARYSAAGKGNDVWVMLQPLENTKLWSADFYEEFRKYLLDQALSKVIETRDLDSVRSMYEGLLESFINTQINNSSSGNTRVSKKKKPEEETLRISVRQSEGAFRYKEIVVKRHKNYIQVVLVPNGIKQNSLSVEAMKELKDAFVLAKKDPNCHAVLLNSSGSYFCTGVDLSPLVGSNKKQAAEDLANSIRDLVMTLAFFTKPVVAAVNGTAVGFGVSLLTYCDVILASDKATFCLPSAKIGYLPEGGATLTLPQVVGTSAAAEMFLQGRRLTADEAKRCGLVSEVLWPTSLMNDVMPRLERIAQQPLQAMEATKAMVRCHLWGKLKAHMDHERRLLVEHWLAPQCQENIKNVLKNGWFDD